MIAALRNVTLSIIHRVRYPRPKLLYTTCVSCGKLGNKAEMYHHDIEGWFCSEEEFAEYWQSSTQ